MSSFIRQAPHDFSGSQTASEVCAAADLGGGVESQSHVSFLTYTVAPMSSLSIFEELDDAHSSKLESAASKVAKTLPIYLQATELQAMTLVSLPTPDRQQASLEQQLPWYFIHSAMHKRHAIVGSNSRVATLLRVLRRPWCILELCCAELQTVHSLLDFATLAGLVDKRGYHGAIELLSHEIKAREAPDDLTCPVPASIEHIEEVSSALFLASESSYNSLWLRVIYTCALHLNISISEVGKLLSGNFDPANDNNMSRSEDVRRILNTVLKRPKFEDEMILKDGDDISLPRDPIKRPSVSMSDLPKHLNDMALSDPLSNQHPGHPTAEKHRHHFPLIFMRFYRDCLLHMSSRKV